jgi:hypothetical protein
LHPLAVTYVKGGIGLFAIVLAVGWWFARDMDDTDTAAALVCTVVGVFVALAAAQLLGHVVDRARPTTSSTASACWTRAHRRGAGRADGRGARLRRCPLPRRRARRLALGALVAFACVRSLRSPLARILDRSATMALEPLIRRRRPDAERV